MQCQAEESSLKRNRLRHTTNEPTVFHIRQRLTASQSTQLLSFLYHPVITNATVTTEFSIFPQNSKLSNNTLQHVISYQNFSRNKREATLLNTIFRKKRSKIRMTEL